MSIMQIIVLKFMIINYITNIVLLSVLEEKEKQQTFWKNMCPSSSITCELNSNVRGIEWIYKSSAWTNYIYRLSI